MKHYLSIDGHEFGNCSQITITPVYRGEKIKKTLSGKLCVDRIGGEQLEISAKLNMLNAADVEALRTSQAKVISLVSFFVCGELITKSMRLKHLSLPSPIYFYGNPSSDYIYGTLTIGMEEI